jgi:LemA protein
MGIGLVIALALLGGLALLAVILVVWGIGTYNTLTRSRIGAQGAFSGIDVELRRRHDLIPNLVNTVKGYAAHEKGTLEAVISARASATRPNITMDERMKAEQGLSGALARLMAVAEAYPDLKANQNFLHLQGELSRTASPAPAAATTARCSSSTRRHASSRRSSSRGSSASTTCPSSRWTTRRSATRRRCSSDLHGARTHRLRC